jgi:hypothetical protein
MKRTLEVYYLISNITQELAVAHGAMWKYVCTPTFDNRYHPTVIKILNLYTYLDDMRRMNANNK